MKIAIGCDHGGFDLKNKVIEHLEKNGHEVIDFGCDSKESVDYPEFGHKVGHAVVDGEAEKGIVICSTGIGISISANKVPGVRAALCCNDYMAKMTRLHNDSNVLAMGASIVGPGMALSMVDTFLSTEFSEGERHIRRINKIEAI